MYNNTLDRVSAYIQQHVYQTQLQSTDQQDVDAENCTQVPYHIHLNDILTRYPPWSTDSNDIANINEADYREKRQDILNAGQIDTPEKAQDNSQVLDDIEVYTQDRLDITQSLNHTLGLRKSSFPGAQPVTVAMVQSNQLTTKFPTHLSNMSIGTGQPDDSDYQDDREEELYQVDGTMDVHSPTDDSDDNENGEQGNIIHKRPRKKYAPADTVRKKLTKQSQAAATSSS